MTMENDAPYMRLCCEVGDKLAWLKGALKETRDRADEMDSGAPWDRLDELRARLVEIERDVTAMRAADAAIKLIDVAYQMGQVQARCFFSL